MKKLISYILSKIEKFFSQFALLAEEEVRSNFPHHQYCQCDRLLDKKQGRAISNLEEKIIDDYVNVSDHWLSLSTVVKRYILRCRHCGACAEYSPVSTES